jgi:hypothetical protein
MVGLSGLWMPIVLSAVGVFIVSSLIHMVFKWHQGEYQAPPNQDALADAMRPFNLAPGEYIMPYAGDMKQMATPEFQARVKKGPNVMMVVRPNEMGNMGRMLALWFVYSLGVSVFSAYVTGRALPQGADYLQVFRFAGVTAFCAYALGIWQHWIWWGKSLRSAITTTIDGLIYACITGGVFGWLWLR